MKFSVAAALFTFVASACAQTTSTPSTGGISVVHPTSGIEWKAGTTQTVTWNVVDAAQAKTIEKITLRAGSSNNLTTAYIIDNTQFDASTGKYDWAIDAKTETAVSYSVEVTTNSGSSYSPYFTIIGAAPGTTDNSKLGVQPGDEKKTSSTSASADSAQSSTSTEKDESAASSLKFGALVGTIVAGTAVALF
ncbi:hypothetical protein BDA99DRAFT_524769 [Phascolomyces articulosus]|uniref:Yeast cell wall synthesis Kre9/Knh1-like N-terminal domain-containing protein n=1 Tax=Phascolomyces articulosus TaxID=60185 RepID=A0AAD5JZD0_9FUNG|nr:hypothetical protein BDA99DRAFT_524769 [Phascolomyces articulosus]